MGSPDNCGKWTQFIRKCNNDGYYIHHYPIESNPKGDTSDSLCLDRKSYEDRIPISRVKHVCSKRARCSFGRKFFITVDKYGNIFHETSKAPSTAKLLAEGKLFCLRCAIDDNFLAVQKHRMSCGNYFSSYKIEDPIKVARRNNVLNALVKINMKKHGRVQLQDAAAQEVDRPSILSHDVAKTNNITAIDGQSRWCEFVRNSKTGRYYLAESLNMEPSSSDTYRSLDREREALKQIAGNQNLVSITHVEHACTKRPTFCSKSLVAIHRLGLLYESKTRSISGGFKDDELARGHLLCLRCAVDDGYSTVQMYELHHGQKTGNGYGLESRHRTQGEMDAFATTVVTGKILKELLHSPTTTQRFSPVLRMISTKFLNR